MKDSAEALTGATLTRKDVLFRLEQCVGSIIHDTENWDVCIDDEYADLEDVDDRVDAYIEDRAKDILEELEKLGICIPRK